MATNNWWGDPSGPHHADLNPEGAGYGASDRVTYSPYMTAMPTLWEEVMPSLHVVGGAGYTRDPSPLYVGVRARRSLRFQVYAYREPDRSDMWEVEEYTWRVPASLGKGDPGSLTLTTVAPVDDVIVFEAEGATAEYRLVTRPGKVSQVLIEPKAIEVDPGGSQTFRASARDEFGNKVGGRSFRWHTVGDVGTINVRTGAFTAGELPGEGYVIAAVSREMVMGDAAADISGSSKVTVGGPRPTDFALHANAPNPFNPGTLISFDLPYGVPVVLTVYNALGQEVKRLADRPYPAGSHRVRWHPSDQPSGMYLYRLEAGPFRQMRKMLLVR